MASNKYFYLDNLVLNVIFICYSETAISRIIRMDQIIQKNTIQIKFVTHLYKTSLVQKCVVCEYYTSHIIATTGEI